MADAFRGLANLEVGRFQSAATSKIGLLVKATAENPKYRLHPSPARPIWAMCWFTDIRACQPPPLDRHPVCCGARSGGLPRGVLKMFAPSYADQSLAKDDELSGRICRNRAEFGEFGEIKPSAVQATTPKFGRSVDQSVGQVRTTPGRIGPNVRSDSFQRWPTSTRFPPIPAKVGPCRSKSGRNLGSGTI